MCRFLNNTKSTEDTSLFTDPSVSAEFTEICIYICISDIFSRNKPEGSFIYRLRNGVFNKASVFIRT